MSGSRLSLLSAVAAVTESLNHRFCISFVFMLVSEGRFKVKSGSLTPPPPRPVSRRCGLGAVCRAGTAGVVSRPGQPRQKVRLHPSSSASGGHWAPGRVGLWGLWPGHLGGTWLSGAEDV